MSYYNFAPTGTADSSDGKNNNIFNFNSTTFGQIRGTYAPCVCGSVLDLNFNRCSNFRLKKTVIKVGLKDVFLLGKASFSYFLSKEIC